MTIRKTGRESSQKMASLGSQALRKPETVTQKEVQQLGGSVLANREPPTVPAKPQPRWWKFMNKH
jgi:hypothetical protein